MRGSIRRALVTALTVATAVVTAVGPAQAKAETTRYNCPDGAVCLYAEGAPLSSTPTNIWYSYGAHNLSGQYNKHWIFNNQYGWNAYAQLCTGYDGTGDCSDIMGPQDGIWRDFTPINSVVLYLYYPGGA